jgi:hypothetical protein
VVEELGLVCYAMRGCRIISLSYVNYFSLISVGWFAVRLYIDRTYVARRGDKIRCMYTWMHGEGVFLL